MRSPVPDTPRRAILTPAMQRLLADLAAAEAADELDDAEIVCEGITCWQGMRQVSYQTVQRLLAVLAVSDTSDTTVRRYVLNECGRAILTRPALAEEIAAHLAAGGASFTISADARILAL